MKKIDYEFRILELEERNKYLESEYKWLWEQFKRVVKRTDTIPDIINQQINKVLNGKE